MVIARQQLPRDVINLCAIVLLFERDMLELYSLISLEYKKKSKFCNPVMHIHLYLPPHPFLILLNRFLISHT